MRIGKQLTILFILLSMMICTSACVSQGNTAQKNNRIAGNIIYFDDLDNACCRKAIITVEDGEISSVDEYQEGIAGVNYLDDDMIIYPGLLDLHNHAEAGMYTIFTDKVQEGSAWDNRFEWRNSQSYQDNYRIPNTTIMEKWDSTFDNIDSDLTVGNMIMLYSELQAISGGTVLQQEEGKSDKNSQLDNHDRIAMVRSTSDAEDLGREDGLPIQSILQLYLPDKDISPNDPSSYMAGQDTNWNIKSQMSPEGDKTYLESVICSIKNNEDKNAGGYLIHIAEGRAGNFEKEKGTDDFCEIEFSTFKSELEQYVEDGVVTKDQIRNAHINLIHASGVNLDNPETYEFMKDYGLGILWSPVSNLLLYNDTPAFWRYLGDDSIRVLISSDWSPSGSKNVWDECKFVLDLVQSNSSGDGTNLIDLKENILKSVTISAAESIGCDKLGNIEKGCYADFMILETDKVVDDSVEVAIDSFFECDECDISMVYVNGNPMYGDESYINSFLTDDGNTKWCSVESSVGALNHKYYNITNICDSETFTNLLSSFKDLIIKEFGSVSLLRSSEDEQYLWFIDRLHKDYCTG